MVMVYRFKLGNLTVTVQSTGWEVYGQVRVSGSRKKFLEWAETKLGPYGHPILGANNRLRPSDLHFALTVGKEGEMVQGTQEVLVHPGPDLLT